MHPVTQNEHGFPLSFSAFTSKVYAIRKSRIKLYMVPLAIQSQKTLWLKHLLVGPIR